MVLRALQVWLPRARPGWISILGDALGVLQATVKRAAKAGNLNSILQELALLLGHSGRSLEALHIWSELNSTSDALSRLFAPGSSGLVPSELEFIPRCDTSPRSWVVLNKTRKMQTQC